MLAAVQILSGMVIEVAGVVVVAVAVAQHGAQDTELWSVGCQ